MLIINYAIFFISILTAISLTYVTLRIIKSDKEAYREVQSVLREDGKDFLGGLARSFNGETVNSINGDKHFLMRAGLKMKKSNNELMRQGRLSEEAIKSLLEPIK